MKLMYWITVLLLILAISGSANLSLNDWMEKDVCPKILGVPACYIVLVFFVAAGISHIIGYEQSTKIYYLFVGIPALIALTGTVVELSGTEICPRTGSGIPMCYISLALCVSLILSKYFSTPQ